MRFFITTIVLTSFLGRAAAQQDDEARTILERAIKAHGGKKNIMKLRIAKVDFTSRFNLPGKGAGEIIVTDTYQLPKQFMKVIKGKINDMKVDLTWAVVDGGERWWHREGDAETVLHNERRDILTQYRPYLPLEQLVLMLESKESKLKSLGEKKEKKRILLGLRFASKTPGSTDLYFDKATSLLAMTQHTRTLPGSKKEGLQETAFSEYKKSNNLMLFHRQISSNDGLKVGDVRITDVTTFEKLDDKIFAEP